MEKLLNKMFIPGVVNLIMEYSSEFEEKYAGVVRHINSMNRKNQYIHHKKRKCPSSSRFVCNCGWHLKAQKP